MNKYFLVLEDGTCFEGSSLPQQKNFPERAGEVVFNTTHSGYEEIATDPSYFTQIVVMTAPMQGNYGVDGTVWESTKLWIQGFVCVQMQNTPREHSWPDRLVEHNIPVLTDVDTRNLVLKLREQGTPWGALVFAADENHAKEKATKLIKEAQQLDSDWVYLCSRTQIEDRTGRNPSGPKVAVLDFGAKENILRELEKRCSKLRIFNSRTSFEDIMSWQPDSIILTNGPGDPAAVQVAPGVIKKMIGNIPIFGICMGHQVLSLALGAKTYKLKFGHRGANHPIRDNLLNKIYMSSQNHGYAVQNDTLPNSVRTTHVNLNDQTVAGFYSEKLNILGIQYHPESHPGPHEATELFDFFIEKMNLTKLQNQKGSTSGNISTISK